MGLLLVRQAYDVMHTCSHAQDFNHTARDADADASGSFRREL